jgi:hypothetical protein
MRKNLVVIIVALLIGAALGWVAYAQGTGDDGAVEDFVPTEKLPADSAISFPVDI